jgi:hypothetical protein
MNATIVSAWEDDEAAHIAISVDEGERDPLGKPILREYIGVVPVTPEWAGLTAQQKRITLIAAASAARDESRNATRQRGRKALAYSGAITI